MLIYIWSGACLVPYSSSVLLFLVSCDSDLRSKAGMRRAGQALVAVAFFFNLRFSKLLSVSITT